MPAQETEVPKLALPEPTPAPQPIVHPPTIGDKDLKAILKEVKEVQAKVDKLINKSTMKYMKKQTPLPSSSYMAQLATKQKQPVNPQINPSSVSSSLITDTSNRLLTGGQGASNSAKPLGLKSAIRYSSNLPLMLFNQLKQNSLANDKNF